jgi:hypothetical protein
LAAQLPDELTTDSYLRRSKPPPGHGPPCRRRSDRPPIVSDGEGSERRGRPPAGAFAKNQPTSPGKNEIFMMSVIFTCEQMMKFYHKFLVCVPKTNINNNYRFPFLLSACRSRYLGMGLLDDLFAVFTGILTIY